MAKLPRQLKARQVIKVLERLGFRKAGSRGGSHVHFRHSDGRWTQVAVHAKPIPQGTLKAIIRQIKITNEQFIELARK